MPQRLPLTPKIRDLITSATDGGVDPESVAVFESISINTLPVNKKRNIFDKAVHAEQTLREMAAVASARPATKHIPVHVVHDQSYGELPIGKVFHAEFLSNDGVGEVRSLFYVGNNEKDILAKMEAGSIEEVSVGVSYKHINCSQCGWDYMSPEAGFDNFYDRKCGNDHAIGTDGVHVILNGLDQWLEQSVVSLGAAQGAKIVPHTKALLGNERYTALAATGKDPSATILYASATIPEKEQMDLTQLIKELTDSKAANLDKDKEITSLRATSDKVAALEAEKVELEKKIAALQTGEAPALQKKLDEANEKTTAALSVVRKEADRLAVASGGSKLPDTATVAELSSSIDACRTKLQATFGGKPEEGANRPTPVPSIFKSVRK